MLKHLRPAFSIVVLMTALTGIAYPLAITGVAQAIAPAKANGSLIIKNGDVIGSRLIGQSFNSDGYFWPRPSATASVPYNADASGGSNYGPTSANLRSRVTADITRLAGIGMRAPQDQAWTLTFRRISPARRFPAWQRREGLNRAISIASSKPIPARDGSDSSVSHA
jgi:K+-transporting ATPase KdpC subunit